jgi:type IV secretion system protein TrbB
MNIGVDKAKRLETKLERELGPAILLALKDPNVLDVALNPDGLLWTICYDGKRKLGKMQASLAESLMTTIADILGTTITGRQSILEGELRLHQQVYRFAGIIPPNAIAPTFSIRKPPQRIFTLDQYCESGHLTPSKQQVLLNSIRDKKNIIVVGGTGSGKTTFVNAMLDCMKSMIPDERVIIIEDTNEIQCSLENSVTCRTSDGVDMGKLLRLALRMFPDRIMIGEVRGGEALQLLKAWNTGHPGGLTTVHANSATDALLRIEQMISEVTHRPVSTWVGQVVDVLVYIEKREVKDIIGVLGYDQASGYRLQKLN